MLRCSAYPPRWHRFPVQQGTGAPVLCISHRWHRFPVQQGTAYPPRWHRSCGCVVVWSCGRAVAPTAFTAVVRYIYRAVAPQLRLDHLKSNMVYTKSHFSHFPDFPTDTNAWSFLVNHPLGLPAPLPDHVMFIDGLTGFKRPRYQFLERVQLAAAALTTSRGGLGLKPTDMVAVLSENCLVIITSLQCYIRKLRDSLTSIPRTM